MALLITQENQKIRVLFFSMADLLCYFLLQIRIKLQPNNADNITCLLLFMAIILAFSFGASEQNIFPPMKYLFHFVSQAMIGILFSTFVEIMFWTLIVINPIVRSNEFANLLVIGFFRLIYFVFWVGSGTACGMIILRLRRHLN